MTLNTALWLAMQANAEIAIALREREAIEGVKIQAATRPNPTLSTSIQDTRRDTRQTYLQINQEFELGNKREARIQAADTVSLKADAELAAKQAEVHANVVSLFFEVLAAQQRLDLSLSSLEVARLGADAAGKRVTAGKSAPVEEIKSKIAESNAKIAVNLAQSQLNSARKRLTALWGNSSPVFARALGELDQLPQLPNLAELTDLLENAPALKVAQAEVNTRGRMIAVERSKTTPNITLSAGVINNQELELNQALLGINVPIPLFDRNQGNLQEAISRRYKAQDELIALRTRLESELVTQYERLRAAQLAATSVQTDILPGAQRAFEMASEGFNAGKFAFLDVLDAQRTLFQAKSHYTQVLLDAHQAVANIEHILGDVVTHPPNKVQE